MKTNTIAAAVLTALLTFSSAAFADGENSPIKDFIKNTVTSALNLGVDVLADTGIHAMQRAEDVASAGKQAYRGAMSSTEITGTTKIIVEAQEVTSAATGEDSQSLVDIGTISGSTITGDGDTEIKVKVGNVTSLASGKNSTSVIGIGQITNSVIEGNTLIDVDAQNVSSIATGDDSTSIVKLGAIDDAKITGDTSIKVKVGNVTSAATANKAYSHVRVGNIY